MIRQFVRLLPATVSLTTALLSFVVVVLACSVTQATVIVNDTWNSGLRSNPPATLTAPYSTTYSENGVDQDSSGDLNSAWFARQLPR